MSVAIENKVVLPTVKSDIDDAWVSQDVLMIGPPKVGKSQFWSYGDKTLYIQCEPGLKHVSVMKVVCNSWGDFRNIFSALVQAGQGKEPFPYDTIVIDTIDRLVDFANDETVAWGKDKFKASTIYGIGDIPNGQGYSMTRDMLASALAKMSGLPACIALIGHLSSKELNMENNVKMTVQTISLSPSVGNMVCAWADHILNIEGGRKSGERKVRTRPTPSIMAGTRNNKIPEDFSWTADSAGNYKRFRGYFK